MSRVAVVVTTIFEPSVAMQELAAGCRHRGWDLLVVGDAKTPNDWSLEGARFYSLEEQRGMSGFAEELPVNSYARKNFGYLQAVAGGAEWIIDTDDDNLPLAGFWNPPRLEREGRGVELPGWVNAYRFFAEELIWPRGYPLELIRESWDCPPSVTKLLVGVKCAIQQGLANENPDVDAIFRMTRRLPFCFRDEVPLILRAGSVCPINSQNTKFSAVAFPLLYLPSHCSFRMADIWRGLVAQRVLHAVGLGVCFESATTRQDRNEHDLRVDFQNEIEGYVGSSKFWDVLQEVKLAGEESDIPGNLELCYGALVDAGFFPQAELELVKAWVSQVKV